MPGKPLEESDTVKQEDSTAEEKKMEEENVTKELTQTDRLNKKLLSSFLERMNTSNMFSAAQNVGNKQDDTQLRNDEQEFE